MEQIIIIRVIPVPMTVLNAPVLMGQIVLPVRMDTIFLRVSVVWLAKLFVKQVLMEMNV
jgi:hypothetical protein